MIPAYEAIRNLLGIYCELIDAGDFENLGALFTQAALLDDDGTQIAKGAAAATAMWTDLICLYDGSPRTRHSTMTPVIDLAEDGTAVCRSRFLVFQQIGSRVECIAAGRYRDTFASSEGTWHFTSRQFFLDQIGDLTQHMVGI